MQCFLVAATLNFCHWCNRAPTKIGKGSDKPLHSCCTPRKLLLACEAVTTTILWPLNPGPPGWAGARRELLDFMVQGKINRGRHTDHPAGRYSIRTNMQCPPPPSPIFAGRMPFLPPNQQCQRIEGNPVKMSVKINHVESHCHHIREFRPNSGHFEKWLLCPHVLTDHAPDKWIVIRRLQEY